ncbi:ABC transporter ATP-binding protein [Bacillus sp. FJAT-27251]|uniref:ABC transporter ATP-binding protein n=1 Tax=Bacillus sp. FJAT-27251 TaxID=1684142 RepID=UPI0006A75FCA|nr:ABC transporter ATP-binding protein [Bacillus sp. FJAT-27251]
MLVVKGLTKKFKDLEAVKKVAFSVEKGEAFGLLGPNGAGKTTTIQMITGLFPPTSGQIFIDGFDMVKNPKKAQSMIGIVPQEIALYPAMSAAENLKFWGRMYGVTGAELEHRVSDILELIGLKDRAKDKVGTFSGGMKRRVNIGAAIMHKPHLLIMDEPTVGIDPQSRSHILETVKQLNQKGMTVIYTSHYMEEVQYLCQRVGIMDHGVFITSGTIPELRETIGDRSRINLDLASPAEGIVLDAGQLAGIDQADIVMNPLQITIFHKDPQLVLAGLIQHVTSLGLAIKGVEIIEPNLESVFLHLTGRSLRD